MVSTLYPPEFNAGGTLACHHLALALRERGHEVSVFAGGLDAVRRRLEPRSYEHDGIRVTSINVRDGYGPVVRNYSAPDVVAPFEQALAAAHPDVVHFHSLQGLGVEIVGVAKRAGAGVVVTMHDWWFACPQQFTVTPPPSLRMCPPVFRPERCDCIPEFPFVERRRMLDRMLDKVDRVLAVSSFQATSIRANGLAPDRVTICANGLVPARGAERMPSTVVRFAFLGGPHPWKGGGVVARALQRMTQNAIRMDVYGVTAAEWEAFGAGAAPRCVRLHPAFAPDALPRVMADADVVLVPSLTPESFSLVTREAFQHGVPVIASDAGGPREVIRNGENGFLVPRGDPDALAVAMQRFVEDSALRAKASAGAAATPVRGIAEQAEQIESIYTDAIRSRTTSGAGGALPKSVLLLSGIEGAPHRYRVDHLVEQLGLLGVRAEAFHCHDRRALARAAEAEIVVLYRVPWNAYVEAIVERVRRAGGLPVFSIDDLIFDPSLREFRQLEGLRPAEISAWHEGVRLYRATLDACDAFLGSTEALARAAEATGKRAFVHRNTLSFELLELSEAARRDSAARARERLRIGYFSGTRTHIHDFASIAAPLARVLTRHPKARLVIAGYMTVPPALERLSNQIERLPFVPWRELPGHIANVDVNVVPLVPGTFNDAKSELKYFEAGAAGVVTVASQTEPFRRAIRHGENGLLAATDAEWESALDALLSSPDERKRLARAAREDAFFGYGPWTAAQDLAKTLRELAELRGGAPLKRVPPVAEETFAAFIQRGIGVGEAALEPIDARPGPCQLGHTRPSARITGRTTLSQRFRCPEGILFRMDVMVGTHRGLNLHDLALRIHDARTGAELARTARDASLAVDNAWLAFELPDLDTRGRELVATFEAPSAAAAEGLSIWCEPKTGDSAAEADDLCFRTWFRADGWAPEVPFDVSALPPEEAVAKLSAVLRRERERTDALEARLRRTEQRLAMATRPAAGEDAIAWVRTTLPYRAARKVYRAGRALYRTADGWLRSR